MQCALRSCGELVHTDELEKDPVVLRLQLAAEGGSQVRDP